MRDKKRIQALEERWIVVHPLDCKLCHGFGFRFVETRRDQPLPWQLEKCPECGRLTRVRVLVGISMDDL